MTLKYYIFENPNDKRKADLKHEIRTKLQTIVTDPAKADIILVLWGDGTMIDAIHKLHQYNKPFFGVNCGTLWFLANDISSEKDIPTSLKNLEMITEPFIEWVFTSTWWIQTTAYAVNDILVNHDIREYPEFTIHEHKGESVTSLRPFTWSATLISSAIGSTGYRANNNWSQIPVWTNTIGVMWIISRPFSRKRLRQCNTINHSVSINSPRIEVDARIDWKQKWIQDVKEIVFKYSEKTFSLLFDTNGKYKNYADKTNDLFAQKFEPAFE